MTDEKRQDDAATGDAPVRSALTHRVARAGFRIVATTTTTDEAAAPDEIRRIEATANETVARHKAETTASTLAKAILAAHPFVARVEVSDGSKPTSVVAERG